MTVYDFCPFLDENDLYELRLNQHWNFVDKFIVVEASETHTGHAKPFNFDQKRFEKYSEKLIYVQIDFHDAFTSNDFLDSFTNFDERPPEWIRDNYQGNYFTKILKDLGAQDDDIIYASSLDEIIREEAFYESLRIFKNTKNIKFALQTPPNHPPHLVQYWHHNQNVFFPNKVSRPIMGFHMEWFVYKFNLTSHIRCPMGNITEYSTYKQILPATMRHMALSTHPPIGTTEKPAGWHFTFLDDTNGDKIIKKLDSYAHHVDYMPEYLNLDKHDVTLKMLRKHRAKKKPLTFPDFPSYLIDNLDKFKNYIFEGST